MNLLAFEYACAGGTGGHTYIDEGRVMLASLLRDCQKAGLDLLTSLVIPELDCGDLECTLVPVHGSLMETARDEMEKHDAVWIVAPEPHGRLLSLTRLAESIGIRLIGSTSPAVEICSDKFLTSRRLAPLVAMPDSRPFEGTYDRFPCVVKPLEGAACDNTFLVKNPQELAALSLPQEIGFIAQPFIEGDHLSAGIVSHGDEVELLGVCRQNIEIGPSMHFKGVEGPVEYPHMGKVRQMARTVKEAIPGLHGYWGIDFIDTNGKLTLIEINPRLTSSYPLYSRVSPFNIARYAIFGKKQ